MKNKETVKDKNGDIDIIKRTDNIVIIQGIDFVHIESRNAKKVIKKLEGLLNEGN